MRPLTPSFPSSSLLSCSPFSSSRLCPPIMCLATRQVPLLCAPAWSAFRVVGRRRLCAQPRAPKPSDHSSPKGFGHFLRHRPTGEEAAPTQAGKGKAAEGGAKRPSDPVRDAGKECTSASAKESKQASSPDAKGGGGGGGSKPPPDGGSSSEGGPPNGATVAMAAIASLLLTTQLFSSGDDPSEITFADFRRELLESGSVERIVIVNKSKARVHMRGSGLAHYWFSLGSVNGFEKKLEQAQADIGTAQRDYIPVTYESETNIGAELLKLAPTLLLVAFWIFMMRGGIGSAMGGGAGGRNIFQVGKSKPTIINKETKTGITFKDVAGLAEAKVEVMELVDFLKNPERYKKLGAKIPKGALLVGPPGTGKTLLAKATAGEASVPFLSISGSDFIEMFVGVGPSRVRDLFAQAKSMQPCIVWIDEIDAVGRARGKGGMAGGNDERENTLNQLLVEMDGFSSSGNIVVMGGTNRADILDPALMRPGRFDRTIEISAPDIKGRAEIFRVHLPKLRLADELEEVARKLSTLTPGFSGAEIANVVNEGALIAARHKKDAVGMDDFHAAMDRVIGGLEKKSKVMTVEDKRRVAHHEAGHATVGWFLQHAAPLLKVSIVPRGMAALGYAQYVPKERKLHTKDQMVDTMCMMLGGRIAEKLFFGNISTGAQDDQQKVTRIAYSLVTLYGFNQKIGNMSFPPEQGGMSTSRPYSERQAEVVDEEVRALVKEAYDRTTALLTEKKELARGLAQLLLEKEVIQRDEVESVLGVRQWREATTYEELVAGVGNSNPEINPNAAQTTMALHHEGRGGLS